MMKKKYLSIAILILIFLFIIGYLIHLWPQWYYDYQRYKVKQTETKIAYIGHVLIREKPHNVDLETLIRLLEKNNYDKSILKDSWGSQILVEVNKKDIVNSYRVVSFGKDKKKGNCCKKWVDDFDSDLVWEDGRWLQSYSGSWETYKGK